MSESTPRERRHQRTRDAILQAARELIREKGADKLSLRAIARKIDYSPAGLYEYFGSKDEIIEAVCMQANQRLYTYLDAVSRSLPMYNYLIDLGVAYVRFARENPELFTLLFNNLNGPDEAISPQSLDPQDAFTIAVEAVQRGIEIGAINIPDDQDVIEVSYGLWALVHGLAVLQVTYLQQFPFNFARADRQAIEVYVRGLLQDTGS